MNTVRTISETHQPQCSSYELNKLNEMHNKNMEVMNNVVACLQSTVDLLREERQESRIKNEEYMQAITNLSKFFTTAIEKSPLMETIRRMHIGLVADMIKSKFRKTNEAGLDDSIAIRVKIDADMYAAVYGLCSTECLKCITLIDKNYGCIDCEIISPRTNYLPKSGTKLYCIKTMERVQSIFGNMNWYKTFPSGHCAFIVTPCYYQGANANEPRMGVVLRRNGNTYSVWFPLELKEIQDEDCSAEHVLPFVGIPLRGTVIDISPKDFKVERSVVFQHNPNGSSRIMFKFVSINADGYLVAGVANYALTSSIPHDLF